MQSPRSRRVGDDKERRQKGFLPDFRDAIKAARRPREGDRAPAGDVHSIKATVCGCLSIRPQMNHIRNESGFKSL